MTKLKGAADLELAQLTEAGSETKVCVVNLLIFWEPSRKANQKSTKTTKNTPKTSKFFFARRIPTEPSIGRSCADWVLHGLRSFASW